MFASKMIKRLKENFYRSLSIEISKTSWYFDQVIQYARRDVDNGFLFESLFAKKKIQALLIQDLNTALSSDPETRAYILMNGNLNYSLDIQILLSEIKSTMNRHSRLGVVAYNPYLRGLYWILIRLGLQEGEPPSTFVTRTDILNLARLSGFEIVRSKFFGILPFSVFRWGAYIEKILFAIPLFRALGMVEVLTFRPIVQPLNRPPTLSIVVPARNERGNIEDLVKRLPEFSTPLEIIFVEGHSRDSTWEEIQRVSKIYSNEHIRISAYQQTGVGKNDAVRLGFSKATGDLLTILDADLSVPPEMISRFYRGYITGLADFINGSRLVYPMEIRAMRFLNLLGNVFFAKALGYVLDLALGDSLCGTKLFTRRDYLRFLEWRSDFGDFDPFGDFELLFPAAVLALGVRDIPVRYRARVYGETNIQRFTHGFELLKMTLIGFFKIKLGFTRIQNALQGR